MNRMIYLEDKIYKGLDDEKEVAINVASRYNTCV